MNANETTPTDPQPTAEQGRATLLQKVDSTIADIRALEARVTRDIARNTKAVLDGMAEFRDLVESGAHDDNREAIVTAMLLTAGVAFQTHAESIMRTGRMMNSTAAAFIGLDRKATLKELLTPRPADQPAQASESPSAV